MDSEVTKLLYLWSMWHLLFNKALQQLMLYLYTSHHCTLRQLTVFQGEIVHQLCNIALHHTDTSVCGGKDHSYNSYQITSKTWVVWPKSLVLRIKMISISLLPLCLYHIQKTIITCFMMPLAASRCELIISCRKKHHSHTLFCHKTKIISSKCHVLLYLNSSWNTV